MLAHISLDISKMIKYLPYLITISIFFGCQQSSKNSTEDEQKDPSEVNVDIIDSSGINLGVNENVEETIQPNLNGLRIDIQSLKIEIQRELITLEGQMLGLENRIDLIKEIGSESVDNSLTSRSDHSYKNIINQWDIYRKQQQGFQKELERLTKTTIINSSEGNSILVALNDLESTIVAEMKSLDEFKKTMDGEIIPLLSN
jgi:hypothetical protein